nr:AAA family ATPase [Spirosoma radiotolerans]
MCQTAKGCLCIRPIASTTTTRLKRVSIQNFKSLKDVTLDLQKVNLLIDPNNSGKTNLAGLSSL